VSTIFGKNWKVNRVVKGAPDVYYELGGTILDCRLDPRAAIAQEIGSGEGRQITQKVVAVKPVIEWTQNVRRLEDYIIGYAFISGEGAVPAHTLHVSDGTEHHELDGVKVNTCRVRITQTESIRADISALIKTRTELASVGTFKFRTDPAMFKDAVTTLTIGGASVTKWTEIEFAVDNNVLQEVLGTDLTPTEVEEQEARYTGRITRARSGSSLFADALSGTKKDVVIALKDNQSTPVTKTFTFTDALLRTSRIEDRALGIVFERIEWQGNKLTVT